MKNTFFLIILFYFFLDNISVAEPIKVGILHSLSGTMAISENAVVLSTLLAIDEINDQGGLLGKKIEVVIKDGASNWNNFRDQAEILITKDKVSVVFGCWTSAARKSVKPVFEKHNHLLFYPVQYEGLEQSPNIVYTGAAPNQQLLPAMEWAVREQQVKSVLLIGSDYVFPRSANAILKHKAKELGLRISDELYIPLGSNDLSEVIESISKTKPDMIFNTINGDSNINLFEAVYNNGYTAHQLPIISFSLAEPEIQSMDIRHIKGHYAAWNYFQSLATTSNKKFLAQLKNKAGILIASDPMEAAYFGVHLWAMAVKNAGSANPALVRNHLNQSYQAPSGLIKIDTGSQHVHKTVYIGKINQDKQFNIVWKNPTSTAPQPYPSYRTKKEWHEMLTSLYKGWNKNWAYIPDLADLRGASTMEVLMAETAPYFSENLSRYGDFGILGNYLKDIFSELNLNLTFIEIPKSRLGLLTNASQLSFPVPSCNKYPSDAIWHKVVGFGHMKDKKMHQIEIVGLVRGDKIPEKLKSIISKNGIEVQYVTHDIHNIKKLKFNRVDAIVIDEAQLNYLSSILPFYIFDITFDNEQIVEAPMKACFYNRDARNDFNLVLQRHRQKNMISFPIPPWR